MHDGERHTSTLYLPPLPLLAMSCFRLLCGLAMAKSPTEQSEDSMSTTLHEVASCILKMGMP